MDEHSNMNSLVSSIIKPKAGRARVPVYNTNIHRLIPVSNEIKEDSKEHFTPSASDNQYNLRSSESSLLKLSEFYPEPVKPRNYKPIVS